METLLKLSPFSFISLFPFFKSTDEGIQYAEVLIMGGKTKPRTLPIIDSLPHQILLATMIPITEEALNKEELALAPLTLPFRELIRALT